MRPLRLNADSSAISKMLPQRGHLGRRKLWAAGSGALQASCKVIVDSPRRSHTPHLSRWCYLAWPLWRCHDAIMKLSWPAGADFGLNDNSRARICIKLRCSFGGGGNFSAQPFGASAPVARPVRSRWAPQLRCIAASRPTRLSINGAAGRRAFPPLRERARAAESAA